MDDCIEKLKTHYKLRDNDLNDWKHFIKQEVSKRLKNIRKTVNFYKVSKLLHNENVKTFLYNFQKQFVIVPMNKAAKNLSYVCKQLYISKIFNEIGLNNTPNPPYKSMS